MRGVSLTVCAHTEACFGGALGSVLPLAKVVKEKLVNVVSPKLIKRFETMEGICNAVVL